MPCMFDGLHAIGVDEAGRGKGHACITVIVGHGRGRVIWAHGGARQAGPRPVLPTIDAGAARVDPDRDRRRGRMDRLVRGRAPPERRTRARLVPHRLLDGRRARPGRETVVEPGRARREQNGDRGDARRRIRRAREPRRPDRTPIHGPRHTRRRGSQGPALPLVAAQGTPAHAPAQPVERAEAELKRWIGRASRCRIPEIVELCGKIRRRRDDILTTIRLGYSNAGIEAFDNKIKVTIRMAYGFRDTDNLIAMIKLRCSGPPIHLPTPIL